MQEVEATSRSCIIILECEKNRGGQGLIGVTVDGVSEVMNIKSADIDDVASFTSKVDTNYILAMAKQGENVKILLNIDQVLNF